MKFIKIILVFIFGLMISFCVADVHEHSKRDKLIFYQGMGAGAWLQVRNANRALGENYPTPSPFWYKEWGQEVEKDFGK